MCLGQRERPYPRQQPRATGIVEQPVALADADEVQILLQGLLDGANPLLEPAIVVRGQFANRVKITEASAGRSLVTVHTGDVEVIYRICMHLPCTCR